MGRVKLQLVNEGRGCQQWYSVSLSDTEIIIYLIRNRSKFDKQYQNKWFENKNPFVANGVENFVEPIEVIYLDIERIIDGIGFSKIEKRALGMSMLGYTDKDIAEILGIDMAKIFFSF